MRKFLVALAFLGVLVARASAEVDVEVPPSFKAKGTLGAGICYYRFQGTAGALLSLKFTTSKDAAPSASLLLYDPGEQLVDPAPVKATPTGVQWKNVPLPVSGQYTLVVGAEASADYSLAVTTKFRTSFTGILNLSVGDEDGFPYAAPAGSTLTIVAAPVPDSACTPFIDSVFIGGTGLEFSETVKGTTHSTRVGPLPEGGDGQVGVFNESGPAGDANVTVKVKPPKAKPGKFDVRRTVLGRPDGGETLVGRVLDGDGGTVAVGDGASDIFGAQVVLPSGALESATLVSIASTVAPAIGDDADQAAGPAVRLLPSGTTFPVPVDVTLPFDFTKIPAGATSADIRIRIVEDNGTTTEVEPTSVGASTVTIPTSGFSVCIPIIVSGPPNFGYTSLGALKPGGDEFWLLQITGEFNVGSGSDSRNRKVATAVGQFAIRGDGTLDFSLAEHGFNWSNVDSPPMSGLPIESDLTENSGPQGGTLDWAYDATGTKMVLSGTSDPTPSFRVSRDGKYLAGVHEGLTQPYGEVQFGVRKNVKPLTLASLKGTWTACLLELDASQNGNSGAAGPKTTRAYGAFTFDGAGGCTIAFTQRGSRFNEANGTWSQEARSFNAKDPTYAIDVDGTVLVSVPPQDETEQGTILRVFPGEGLDVLFASHDPPAGEASMAMVLVRQGTGLSRASLNGLYHGTTFSLDAAYYGVPATPLFLPDFNLITEALAATFDGGAAADFTGDRHQVQRDTMGVDGTRVENGPESFTVGVTVTSQGKLSLSAEGKVQGQVSPDGQVLVFVSDTASGDADFGLNFLFRSPPVKVP